VPKTTRTGGKQMEDLTTVLEIARVGLAMVFDEIAEELDISDAELKRIQLNILKTLEVPDASN
jgi:hypothetical protein